MRLVAAAITTLALTLAACAEDGGERSASTTTTAESGEPMQASTSDQLVLACLEPGSTDADIQALWDRVSIPSATGVGTDLAAGIASVAARGNGIAVEFEIGATEVERQHVLDVLDAQAVNAVLSGASTDLCR